MFLCPEVQQQYAHCYHFGDSLTLVSCQADMVLRTHEVFPFTGKRSEHTVLLRLLFGSLLIAVPYILDDSKL